MRIVNIYSAIGIACLPLIPASGLVVYSIDQATVLDGGITEVLDSTHTYTPVADANLQSFRVSSGANAGTTYSVDNFISGIDPSTASINAKGLIQVAGHLDTLTDPKLGTPDAFYTGSSNPASFIAHGERGLSFSTGLNVTVGDTGPTVIEFSVNITSTAAFNDGIPDFIFGDAADNQSDDTIEFLNNAGEAVVSISLTSANWSSLGTHTIDRLLADGSAYNGSDSGSGDATDTTRGISMTAFETDSSDLTIVGQGYADFDAALDAVESIRITANLKTDYAFFGVNTNAISSDDFVAVPEPAQITLIVGLSALLLTNRRPKRSNS